MADIKKCPFCHGKITEADKFCGKCGKPISQLSKDRIKSELDEAKFWSRVGFGMFLFGILLGSFMGGFTGWKTNLYNDWWFSGGLLFLFLHGIYLDFKIRKYIQML
ncbi:MAG: hypothetical protein AABY04_02950 [Candidatus Micrarchaeota archaeon]